MIEEKHQDRVIDQNDDTMGSEALWFTGIASRQSLRVCPLLAKHVSEEWAKESSIPKERRKAREERGLAKPGKP